MATPNSPEEAAPPASSPTPMSPDGDSDEIKPSSSDESLVQELPASHVARLTRRSMEQIEERVEAMELHTLTPRPEKKPAHPLKAMLYNSWVLAIMVAIVALIVVAKGRIHVPEPLAHVHATNGVLPYIMPVDDTSVDYLYLNLLISPYYPHEEGSSSGGDSHRRRRLSAWVGEAVSLRDSGSGGAPPGTPHLLAAEAHSELVRRVKKLLHKPKLALAHRRRNLHRHLLVDGEAQEPPNTTEGEVDLPQLQVMLVQRNFTLPPPAAESVADPATSYVAQPPAGDAFFPVSEPQFCTTKDGAAVKCSMAFQGSDLTAAMVPGEPLYVAFSATQLTQIVFHVEMSELGGLGPAKNWLALAILVVVLVAIASEKIHRMWCAFIGAALMMGLLLLMNMTPSLALVVEWLDESTLALLFGMMIIVGRLQDTGMFELMAAWAVRLSRGRMALLSLLLMLGTAFLSAWLDNVTTMLLIIPVTIQVMRACNQDPIPIMLAQALMSNIGGAATMVGDPPALIIGTALSQYLSFMDFIVNMAPGVIMAAAACVPLLLWMYRSALMGPIQDYDGVLAEVAGYRITDWPLFAKSAYVTGVVLLGFLLHPLHHVDPAWFAVLGAVVLCVADKPMEVEKVVRTVEWDMLLFFAAMFVMIEAAAEIGMIGMIGGWLESAIRATPEGSRTIVAIQILLWVSAFVSGLLDNIPYTITMVPVIEYMASAGLGLDLPTLAWALNFGACFGGNATLIGASANIVTATLAERAGERISFGKWLKGGIPVTIVSVAMADLWMILRFCL